MVATGGTSCRCPGSSCEAQRRSTEMHSVSTTRRTAGRAIYAQQRVRACAQYASSAASLSPGSRPGPPCASSDSAAAPFRVQSAPSCCAAPAQSRWLGTTRCVSDELLRQATAASCSAALRQTARQPAQCRQRPHAAAGSKQPAAADATAQQQRRPRRHAARWSAALQRCAQQLAARERGRGASRRPEARAPPRSPRAGRPGARAGCGAQAFSLADVEKKLVPSSRYARGFRP